MTFFANLFRKKQPAAKPAAETPQKQEPSRTESVYLTKTVTFGMHPYRSADEDSSVYFVDENRGIRKMIIDVHGNIQNFPGMVREDFWVKHVAPNYLKPQIRFRSSFEKWENGWIFLWQLQPDGWYWADEDGFGAEDDCEVVLYTFLDRNGCFTGPFRIYQLGSFGYAMARFLGSHAQSQKQALQAARDEENYVVYPSDLFPQLQGCPVDYEHDRFYQLRGRQEALEYWQDPVLSADLKALAQALLDSEKSLWAMMGKASRRIRPSMTLFYTLTGEPVFRQVLDKFCGGQPDPYTLQRLQEDS